MLRMNPDNQDRTNVLTLGASSTLARRFGKFLQERGAVIHPISRQTHGSETYNAKALAKKIAEIKPRFIFNFVADYGKDISKSFDVNAGVTAELLQALLRVSHQCRCVIIGSAAEYGPQERYEESMTERPSSVYGLTKLMQKELVLQQLRAHPTLDAVYVRPFTVLDTQLKAHLFAGTLSQQLKAALAGHIDKIKLGSLNGIRDYLGSEDVSQGLWFLARHGIRGDVYNLCSNRGAHLESLVNDIQEMLKINIPVEQEQKSGTGTAISSVIGDNEKMTRLGWKPQQSYEDMLRQYCEELRD